MKKLKLTFEKGGSLIVTPLPEARRTMECIEVILPHEEQLIHSRYCGREICFAVQTADYPPRENQTGDVDKFDVAYWRNWESPESRLPGSPGAETINVYYGPETLSFRTKPLLVNIFGRIDENQESVLDEIGNRIWQCGFERVRAEIIESGAQ